MSCKPELSDLLVDMIIDYLEFISDSDTLNEKNLRFTNNELRVMAIVYRRFERKEPCNLSYLIDETRISRATVSRILTTLFEYGLIREESDDDDRRVRILYPTKAGETSMARVSAWFDTWAGKIRLVTDQPTER